MNRRLYRIVFNRALGVLQVVAEIARRHRGRGTSAASGAVPQRAIAVAILLALAGAAQAQAPDPGRIAGDSQAPGAQRPIVLAAPNGVPLVNIATPSAAGVSHNRYGQFDVGSQGAILNNARQNVRTELGGWVQGNPQLARGTARVILNEVGGGAPSRLGGYIEVGGDRAEVVIANPAGIQAEGAGFINASRATLTTGRVQFADDGQLAQFRASDGQITIHGRGLDASGTDYTEVIARAVQVNAGLWANQLQVSTGAGDATTAAPAYALDVSALGGMYANKIHLIGTEAGLGVRNAGTLGAQGGGLMLRADGRLLNSGTLQSELGMEIAASGGIANSGAIRAGDTLALRTSQDLDNRGGRIDAPRLDLEVVSLRNRDGRIAQTGGQALRLQAGELSNRDGGRIGVAAPPAASGTTDAAQPVANADSPSSPPVASNPATDATAPAPGPATPAAALPAPGSLRVAGKLDNDGGAIEAAQVGLETLAGTLDNSGGRLALDALALRHAELRNAGGTLRVAGPAELALARLDNAAGQLWFGATLSLRSGEFINRGGMLQHAGEGDSLLRIDGLLDNDDGQLASNAANWTLEAGTLGNARGAITHAGRGTLSLQSDVFSGQAGRIVGNGGVTWNAGAVDHRGAQLQARRLDITAATLDNRGGQLQASGNEASTLRASGRLDNSQGARISGNGDLALRARQLINAAGRIEHAGTGVLALTADEIDGEAGRLASSGALRIRAGAVNLRDAGTDARRVDIEAATLTTAGGRLTAQGKQATELRVRETLDNTGGTLEGNGALMLTAGALDNQAGTLRFFSPAANRVTLDGQFDNRGGTVLGAGALDLAAAALDNAGGRIATFNPATGEAIVPRQSALTIATREALRNVAGQLSATGAVEIDSAGLDNAGGQIDAAAAALSLQLRGTLRNVDGTLQSAEHLRLATTQLDNQRGRIVGATTALDSSGTFDNRDGVVGTTQGELRVDSGALDNTGGRLQAASNLAVNTRGEQLLNRDSGDGGGLLANGNVDLSSGALDNRGGVVMATQATSLRTGALDNRDAGQISGGTAVVVDAASLLNAGGRLHSGGTSTLRIAADLDNRSGLVTAGDLLDVSAASIDNRDTRQADVALGLQAGSVRVTAQRVANASGLLVAGADATFELASELDNDKGVVSAGNALVLRAESLRNDAGLLRADGRQDLDVAALSGNGDIQSRGDAKVRVRGNLAHEGRTVADGELQLTADGVLENRGALRGGTGTQVRAKVIDNTASGEIDSQGVTFLQADERIVNRGLVDGTTSHLQAPTIDNLGSGRLYGDHVAVAAGTLRNGAEAVDGTTRAGTIAARARLDLGVGTLENRDEALIHSGGDAAVGGALNAERRATGVAEVFRNTEASVDITGELALAARRIENVRNVSTVEVTTTEAPVRLDQPEWRLNFKNASKDIRNTSNYDAREVYYLDPADILEDTPYLTPDGQSLRRAVVRLTPRTSAFLFERGGLYSALGLRSRLAPRDETVVLYYDGRRDDQDNPDQVPPGQRDPFAPLTTVYREPGASAVPAFRYLDEPIAWSADFDACRSGCVQLWAPYAYNDPTRMLINPEGTGGDSLGDNEQYRIATRTTTEQRVAAAGPDAVLQAGGHMRLSTDTLTNTYGRILAGGDMQVVGIDGRLPLIRNTGATLTRTYTFQRESHAYNGTTRKWGAPAISEVIGQVGGEIRSGGLLDLQGDRLDNLDAGREAPGLVARVAPNLKPGPAAREAAGALPAGHVRVGALDLMPALVPAADGSADRIAAGQPDARVPGASLYRHAPQGSDYLVETDPRFADGRQWLGSNYLLQQLGYDPAATLKRLGDGYYEQGLVRAQVAQLTGRRFLDGYASDEEQLRALLDAGATYARQFALRPGLALSDAQMAALTSDIVWLVEQTVTLPDGSTTKALVPKLYVRLRPEDVKPSGAVLAGEAVKADLVGDLVNSGRIAGRQLVDLKGENLRNLGGRIEAGAVGLQSRKNIDNIGGQISAERQLIAVAGGDINQVSTTATQALGDGRNRQDITTLDRLATMTVTAPGGTLLVKADGDYNSQGGQLRNQGPGGQTVVVAEGDINLGTVRVGEQADAVRDASNYRKASWSRDVGSVIAGDGPVALQAGGDITSTASRVDSANGTLTVLADGNITVGAGTATRTLDAASRNRSNGVLSSKTTAVRRSGEESTALGSSFGGKQVVLQGRNISVQGSTVVSDKGTTLVAREDVNIGAAENTASSRYSKQVKQSGVFSGGGIGFSIGSQSLQQDGEQRSVTHTGSVVGSVDGKTTIHAGEAYRQQGSDVIGGEGVAISGKTVAIEDVADTFSYDERQRTRSGGIRISLKGGAADAVNAAYADAQRAGQSDDNRLKALYAARGAQALYGNGSNPVGNIPGQVANSKDVIAKKDGANSGGLNLRIGVGASSTDARQRGGESTSRGSTVYSGNGDVVVVAREGDLSVTGSTVEGINTTLAAAQKLILSSGKNTRESRETNKGGSAEIGLTIGSDAGIGIYASASGFRGKGTGDGVSYSETTIGGNRGTTTFISGSDTVLDGARIIGKRVIGDVGGNLIARSRQDSNQYHAKQVSAGVDAAIGTGGGSVSGYVNASKVDSTYTSVREQTGIQAGDGGYQINVNGKTVLDGAAVASSAEPSRNYFRTGSLEWSDLANEAKYKAVSASVSGGGGSSGGSGSASFQQKSDSASSVTRAGIADGTLIVEDGSGQGIARGVTQLQQDGLKEIFDARKVATQMELGQVAGQVAFTAVGDLATGIRRGAAEDALAAQARFDEAERTGDSAGMAQAIADLGAATATSLKWDDGSANKVALHAIAGAVQAAFGGGNVLPAALGGGTGEYVGGKAGNSALALLAATAMGAATGRMSDALSSALAGYSFNKTLHKEEEAAISALVAEGYEKSALNAVACYEVKCWQGDTSLGVMNVQVQQQVVAAVESMGPQKQAELLAVLKSQAPGQFSYKASDYLLDGWKDYDVGGKLKWLGSSALDLTPVIGDAKAYYEAETGSDYLWATVGLIPFGGDAARSIVKGGKVTAAPTSPLARPSPKTSEMDVGLDLGPTARPQVSFKNGVEVPYGTPGSVRPDWCLGNVCSIEVKNYNILTNRSGLISNVARQAIKRANNLPHGMQQQIIIDIRGQVVSDSQKGAIISEIIRKSDGLFKATDIGFKE